MHLDFFASFDFYFVKRKISYSIDIRTFDLSSPLSLTNASSNWYSLKMPTSVYDATIKYSRWINGLFTVVCNKHIPSNWSFGKDVILENLSVLRLKASFCFRYFNQSFSAAASTAAALCNWLAWLAFWNWKQNFNSY